MAGKTLVYQLFPMSWGSIRMMTLFLPRIAALGVDYVCLCPIFKSPWKNAGYDVADYYTIEPKLGTMKDFDEFVESAHLMGLKVILDLPIDSTSVEHIWFLTEPHRYIIKDRMPDYTRKNLLGNDLAWQKSEGNNYYLALNHPKQATLNWFNGGVLNRGLVECFKRIMNFWSCSRKVDGFRLEFSQAINGSKGLIRRDAVQVINELSNNFGGKTPFLIMDCIDPDGKASEFYAHETDIEFITNWSLRNVMLSNVKSTIGIKRKLTPLINNPKFMLSLESHDVSRFTYRSGLPAVKILETMFSPSVQAVCLYQGQEIGATCADINMPLPLDEYARQEANGDSVLELATTLIRRWKCS